MDNNNAHPPNSDQAFFRQQMADVTPLKRKHDTVIVAPPPRTYSAKRHPPTLNSKNTRIIPEPIEAEPTPEIQAYPTPPTVNANEKLYFSRNMSHKLMTRLKRGKLPLAKTIDLHGLTQKEAQHLLQTFLQEQRLAHQKQVICVVHGKGQRNTHADKPILKNWINQWLPTQNGVMAFCSAQPQHGGTGAVYILLQYKKRPGSSAG